MLGRFEGVPLVPDVDVIIAGVGPVGAALAGLLAQRGLQVAAFDRLADLYPLPRAIGLDHEAMRIFQELGIAERVLPFTAQYRPSEYRGVDGAPIKRLDMAPPPHRLGWAPNHVFDQPALERALRQRLAELPGVTVRYATEVASFFDEGTHVCVDIQAEDGRRERLRAKYLVACDGGSSPIRKALGIGLDDLGFDEAWLVVDAIINDDKLADLPQTQVQYCEPERPCTFVVGPGNHRRWEIMLQPGDSLSSDAFPEDQLWRLLSRWIRPGDGTLRRAAAYRFHGLIAKQWRKGRVLLAGDAAHMTPPFMAQGMVQGLRDAQNLAWKLERVIRGESPQALLETYGTERQPHVETTTRGAIALGRVICERDPAQARARDAAMRAEQGDEIRTTIRQTMVPDLRHGLIAAGTPGAGQLCPQPLVRAAEGTQALLDDLTGARVRTIAIAPLADDEIDALTRATERLGGRVALLGADRTSCRQAMQELQPVMAPWLTELQRTIAIVRPDHYVYGTAATVDDALALLDDLATRLAEPTVNRV